MESHRILVTGSSGFLGRYVVDELAHAGHEVTGFDLVEPRFPIASFLKGDFTKRTELEPALRGMSAVCHLGGVGDVYLAEKDPNLAIRANVFGTMVVCDASVDFGIEKLVYASTWEVYGKPVRTPVDEKHPCNPAAAYSISKLAGELFVRRTDGKNGLETVSLRLGTAYGHHMRESAVISRFIRLGIEQRPLTIFGDGRQFRQFTHAEDIGRGFVTAVSKPTTDQVYNILSDEAITLLDLARLIANQYGSTIVFENARPSEPPAVHISVEKAKRELGWRTRVGFKDGLRGIIEAYESVRANK